MNGGYIPLCPECTRGMNAKWVSAPLPCVRDEHGEMREQTIKRLFAKINEELDELKEAIFKDRFYRSIAEEAADTITAITTLLEALGIDAEMRDEAQRRVNSKNRERGRL